MTDDQRAGAETATTETTTAAEASTTTTTTTPAATGKGSETQPATGKTETAKGGGKASIATGGDTEDEDAAAEDEAAKAAKPFWPDNWREKMAEHIAAGDKKVYEKELRRLQRVSDPTGVYGNWRELDARLNGGGLIKVPGKDAKPEEIAAYHKALGVPEKPEDYIKDLKLENGAVIGDADKPLLQSVSAEMHKAGATPAAVNAMVNWYYKQQEEQAAALDEADDTFRRESEKALKDELGAAFKRKTNAISSLFATAPGGTDLKNEGGLFSRLMGGRMADGRVIGNDPDMVRFLVSLVSEVNPSASVLEDGGTTSMSLDAEIASIEKDMKENRREYFKDEKKQARYRELLSAREKIQARKTA